MPRITPLLAAILLFIVAAARAETPAATADVRVHLSDGSLLVGSIAEQNDAYVTIVAVAGVTITVPRAQVRFIETPRHPSEVAPEPPADETRLFLGPTGRPLRRGEGYFSDHYVFFPGVAYGVSDHITVAGGLSAIPGIALSDQIAYFTPKVGARLSDHAAISVGGLFARGDGDTLTVGYVVSTFGTEEHSLSAGAGAGSQTHDDGDPQPMLMLGGSTRLSPRFSLITENWLFPGEDHHILSGGLRFHGGRLTVDLALLTNRDLFREGGVAAAPWLSFAYHFGARGTARASYRAAR